MNRMCRLSQFRSDQILLAARSHDKFMNQGKQVTRLDRQGFELVTQFCHVLWYYVVAMKLKNKLNGKKKKIQKTKIF